MSNPIVPRRGYSSNPTRIDIGTKASRIYHYLQVYLGGYCDRNAASGGWEIVLVLPWR